jgi:predicted glycosyl hydrolase (DUF1957 family)
MSSWNSKKMTQTFTNSENCLNKILDMEDLQTQLADEASKQANLLQALIERKLAQEITTDNAYVP